MDIDCKIAIYTGNILLNTSQINNATPLLVPIAITSEMKSASLSLLGEKFITIEHTAYMNRKVITENNKLTKNLKDINCDSERLREAFNVFIAMFSPVKFSEEKYKVT